MVETARPLELSKLVLAKVINGPYDLQGHLKERGLLEKVRESKWEMLSSQEQGLRKIEATSVMHHLASIGINYEEALRRHTLQQSAAKVEAK